MPSNNPMWSVGNPPVIDPPTTVTITVENAQQILDTLTSARSALGVLSPLLPAIDTARSTLTKVL